MLATAAKLSRALAATFDVLLSELALEVQLEALLLVTQYPLPASAGNWAGGFWQIVSVKDTNNLSSAFQGRVFIPRPFLLFSSRLGRLRSAQNEVIVPANQYSGRQGTPTRPGRILAPDCNYRSETIVSPTFPC